MSSNAKWKLARTTLPPRPTHTHAHPCTHIHAHTQDGKLYIFNTQPFEEEVQLRRQQQEEQHQQEQQQQQEAGGEGAPPAAPAAAAAVAMNAPATEPSQLPKELICAVLPTWTSKASSSKASKKAKFQFCELEMEQNVPVSILRQRWVWAGVWAASHRVHTRG